MKRKGRNKMRKVIRILVSMCVGFLLVSCGERQSEIKEWTRQGYFSDEKENILTIMWAEEVDEPGWYVGITGEELLGGCVLQQMGNTLHGNLYGWDENVDPLLVTVEEEGEDGVVLTTEDGKSYHFKPYKIPEASIVVTINTEGFGYIG